MGCRIASVELHSARQLRRDRATMSRVPPAVGRQDVEDALVAFSHEPVTAATQRAAGLVLQA
jgi:hypothetical protein